MTKRCTPSCKYFRCVKKALRFKVEGSRLLTIKEAVRRGIRNAKPWCLWTNSECIGPNCQYAYCNKNAMLPNGNCGLAIKAKEAHFDQELEKAEMEFKQIMGGYKKFKIAEEEFY